ncbi:MAG: biotin--[acetyl-CoA-carboxylase] ligase [Nitrospirota bacterium]|nr:biotin--[acetyl-CoA-carboxylase] ligase [Nitrospirota bacterium]
MSAADSVTRTADRLLARLRCAGSDGFVSGSVLARELGISRTAVWKQMQVLQGEGYVIESHPRRGYRLAAAPQGLSPREVTALLTSRWLGHPLLVLPEVDSTNRRALDDPALGHGTVLAALRQTGGRGRLGRRWETPTGTVPFSLVLEPAGMPPAGVPLVTLATAVGLAEGIAAHCGVNLDIKWPNDLLWQGRKVAGILTEARTDPDRITRAVVGIGLNVNTRADDLPPEVRPLAASLAEAVGAPVAVAPLLARVLDRLEVIYGYLMDGQGGEVLRRYRPLCTTLGREVTVHGAGGDRVTGLAEAVGDDGALVLRVEGRPVRMYSGDVSLSAPAGNGHRGKRGDSR